MSTWDKLLKRFLNRPTNFTYDDAKTLLRGFGYSESNKGKTSGSAVAFIKKGDNRTCQILLHKPHPGNQMLPYQIREIIKVLSENGDIKNEYDEI